MKLKTLLVYNPEERVEQELDRIGSLIRNEEIEGVDIITFKEYHFCFTDVVNSLNKIKSFVEEHNCDILMAPYSYTVRSLEEEKNDEALKKLLSCSGVVTESDERPDGIWFDRNGSIFGMNKGYSPVHKLPNRDIGVSICCEVSEIQEKPSCLDGINVILNPSAEGDDVYMHIRNLRYCGKNELELLQELCPDLPLENGKASCLIKGVLTGKFWGHFQNIRFTKDYVNWKEGRFTPRDYSGYIYHSYALLSEKKVLVLRCDTKSCTGLMLLPENVSLGSVSYNEKQCLINSDLE